jgi:hypothetical protein
MLEFDRARARDAAPAGSPAPVRGWHELTTTEGVEDLRPMLANAIASSRQVAEQADAPYGSA